MNGRLIVFINGINSLPCNMEGWTDKAVAWVFRHTEAAAEKFEWWGGPILSHLLIRWRARQLLQLLEPYRGFRIVLVGHSFGTVLICRVLADRRVPPITCACLIASAADADFGRNGLNAALRENCVGEIHLYQSRRDGTLAAARATAWWLRWVRLDFGWLGLTGPRNLDPAVAARVRVIQKPYAHSQWFAPDCFDQTMREITAET